jgi:16S rRNA G966 N2-methylase RsmD
MEQQRAAITNSQTDSQTDFLYTYACHEDEAQLCLLELRSLFGSRSNSGVKTSDNTIDKTIDKSAAELNEGLAISPKGVEPYLKYVLSPIGIDPSRSPFIKQRLEVGFTSGSVEGIADAVSTLALQEATFKVIFVETDKSLNYQEQRTVERQVGAAIKGKAEMRIPQQLFGIARVDGRWLFGECLIPKAVWLEHNSKPQNYSTALSTRMARAVANIAVPFPQGIRAIDPCCGMGTVLIEALSMGIDMIGTDLNPLAVRGARTNLAHFAMPDVAALQDMRTFTGSYDAAVLDMPYNLCSVLSPEEQLTMLKSLRRLADRAVVITTEEIDPLIASAGFIIVDRCLVRKGSFSRQVLVCH